LRSSRSSIAWSGVYGGITVSKAAFSDGRLTLTSSDRRDLFRHKFPRIYFERRLDGPRIGYVCHLSPLVKIEVKGYAHNRRQWVLEYALCDNRPRLLRGSLPTRDISRDRDGHGYVKPPSAASIEDASEDSAYTSSPHAALHDAGEAVDRETQRKFDAEAHARWVVLRGGEEMRRQERAMSERLKQTLRTVPLEARTALLAAIEREIEASSADGENAA